MLGIRYIKAQPTTHLFRYKKGKLVQEGAGLAFFYYSPTTSLVAVPLASNDAPFIFKEVTADFQEITIQGQATYRITDPRKVSQLLDFNLDVRTQQYTADDPRKLPQRLINVIQALTRKELQTLPLREALRASDALVHQVAAGLTASNEITSLGLKVIGLSVLAIKPSPEAAHALEAEAREQILREADEAIYARRKPASNRNARSVRTS
jgi:regulator of protease activity HflC (stomatin/prohibitin superfamily)